MHVDLYFCVFIEEEARHSKLRKVAGLNAVSEIIKVCTIQYNILFRHVTSKSLKSSSSKYIRV